MLAKNSKMADSLDLKANQTRIRFNIGGQCFETFTETLKSFPNTRISDLSPGDPSYCSEKDEYFFDRSPFLFPYILDSFREGEVTFPASLPATSIKSELKFWGLEEEWSATCHLSTGEEESEQNSPLILNKGSSMQEVEERGKGHALWLFLEEPSSSRKAMVWSALYVLVILLSVSVISTMTVAQMQTTVQAEGNFLLPNTTLRVLYLICALFFLIELVLRFAVCPDKLRFFTSFFNDIDILAIIPMFISGVTTVAGFPHWLTEHHVYILSIIYSAVIILRAIRVLKLGHQIPRFRIICLAFKTSLKDLLFLLLLLLVGMVVFSTLLFWAESGEPYTKFLSIPESFWYCIISMTTVGYGDMYPTTGFGKFVGSLCALSGVFVMIMPIAVFVYNYQTHCNQAVLQGGNDKTELRETGKMKGVNVNLTVV